MRKLLIIVFLLTAIACSQSDTPTPEPDVNITNPDPVVAAVIANIQESLKSTSARISWELDLPASAQIAYGETTDLGELTSTESELKTNHSLQIENINKFTTYYYQLISTTAAGLETRSDIRNFKTKPHDIDLSTAVLASSYGYEANDASNAFKEAFNSADPIVIIDKQATDWIINPTKVFNITDKTIIFEEGVIVKAKPNAFEAGNAILLNLSRPNNVKLYGYGATLTMNKEEYTTGEGRHSVSISGGENVTIEGFTISDSGGDGIYLAPSVPPFENYTKDIFIDNVILDNHRRQGMSIISAENVWVSNTTFQNTNGTLPEAGVDLEPNTPDERLVNINFDKCSFINNNHSGFALASLNLNEDSLPISINVTNSYFSNNHVPENTFSKGEISFGANRNSPVKGTLIFDNIEFDGSDWGIFSTRKVAEGYQVQFNNIVARNMGQASTSTNPANGMFTLEVASYTAGDTTTLGNIEFNNVTLDYSNHQSVFYFYDWSTLSKIQNMSGDIQVSNPNPVEEFSYHFNNSPTMENINLNISFQ